MKRMTVEYEPEYLSYVYDTAELDGAFKSIIRQLMPLWKKGKAYGCLCPENITLIQKDHRLYAEVDLNTMFSNPEYDCPESEKTPASDIFSLGLLMHEMLSEMLPFCKGEKDTVREALLAEEKVEVSDLLDDVHFNLISGMLEKEPEQRITYQELAASLEAGKCARRYRRDRDGSAYVSVRLRNEENEPVSGAMISIMHIFRKEEFFDAASDANGEAELIISSGECWISIFADGYLPIDRHFFIYAEDSMDFEEILQKETNQKETSYICEEDVPF
ncbi:MAG: hypothetical protein IKF18_01450 [Erysipelotrichaceae bacterium]|nr:hypothetical protein [Erysipelotrichaceae bacterium]